MAAVVVDASAIVEIFVGRAPDPELRRTALVDDLAAPELIDIEILAALRRLERLGRLRPEQAARAAERIADAPIARATHRPLVHRVWQRRPSITASDAAYVALAEQLQVPLITCDAKLAGSNGHDARIVAYPLS